RVDSAKLQSSRVSTLCHSSLLKGLGGENLAGCPPSPPEWGGTPALPSMSPSTGLPLITPIEPVTVPGWAMIASAAIEMKYPPDAATSLIDTTTGLPALRTLTTSRQIASEATYDPPGLFTRSTMAL